MEKNWNQLLGYLVISFSLLKIVLLVVSSIFNAIFSIYWLIGSIKMVEREGKIRRGYRLWSKPLTPEPFQYLKSLPNVIIEQPQEQAFLLARSSLLLMKSNNEVMIAGGNRIKSSTITFSNRVYMALIIGYANLSRPEPMLEFRIPPSKIWVIAFILLNFLYFISNLQVGLMSGLISLFILFIVLSQSAEGIENFLRNRSIE